MEEVFKDLMNYDLPQFDIMSTDRQDCLITNDSWDDCLSSYATICTKDKSFMDITSISTEASHYQTFDSDFQPDTNNLLAKYGYTGVLTSKNVIKWLQEERQVYCSVSFDQDEDGNVSYYPNIWYIDKEDDNKLKQDIPFTRYPETNYNSYEKCLNEMIKYVLKW